MWYFDLNLTMAQFEEMEAEEKAEAEAKQVKRYSSAQL